MDQSSPLESVASDAELAAIDGGLGFGLGDRVVIIGCTPPWIGQPYPTPF
jgi:hypothetical protein